MGCLFSKNGQVRTLSDIEEPLPASAFSTRGAAHAWLQEIGLPQYAEAFEDAGFSDWDLLSCLTDTDLEAITAHTGTTIPPGHRKKLLMASRQMGTSAAQAVLGLPPPYGSVQRYSRTSNGNDSKGGAGTASAVINSLERRSNGLRPGGSSRVPSSASVHGGYGAQGHLPQSLMALASGQQRNATDDGLVSGRRSRAVAVMVPSRNSSRNSLLSTVAAAGHAIGYIASPSITGLQETAGGGGCDPWIVLDGRCSSLEPGSPPAMAAAVAPGLGGPTPPQRQRRRWSANKLAARGVHAGSNGGGGGGVPFSASSHGWLEPEAAGGVAMSTAGPITDDVRQISVTSSIGEVYDVAAGGGGIGGGPTATQPCISRDLEALVMGPSGASKRAQSSRSQSLAATRPDKSYGGACSVSGQLSSPPHPPHRISGGQNGAAAAVTGASANGDVGGSLQASPIMLGDLPYIRSSIRSPTAGAETQQQPLCTANQSLFQPSLDGYQQQQTSPKHPRVASARDGAAAAATGAAAANTWGTMSQSKSQQRPGSAAADSTLRSWVSAAAAAAPPQKPPLGLMAASRSPPLTPPGVAWASEVDAAISKGAVAATATGTVTAVPSQAQSVDSDGGGLLSSPSGRGVGSPGGALPRFVRAIAGWAIPSPVVSSTASDGAATTGVAAPGMSRAGSGNRQHRGHAHQPVSQIMQAHSRSGCTVLAAGQASQERPPAEEDRPVAGDVLSAAAMATPRAAGSASAARGLPTTEPSLRSQQERGRSQRQMIAPDVRTPRGPWDQNAALCIQGRGYKPSPSPPPPTHGLAMRSAVSSTQGGGGYNYGVGDEDSDAPSSASHHISGAVVQDPVALSIATAAAAVRGGGWPFMMPQLPQPTRSGNGDVPRLPQPLPPAAGGHSDGDGASNGVRVSNPSLLTAAAPALAEEEEYVPTTSGSYGEKIAVSAVAGARMYGLPDSIPSMLLESLASDVSAATTARRAPPVHSSRPRDWCPSGGGGSEDAVVAAAAAENSGVNPSELSVDDLALGGSSALLRPHRVQIVGPMVATSYSAASACKSPLRGGAGASSVQWPIMPLQPPKRSRPPLPPQAVAGSGSDHIQKMDILPRGPPGPSSASAAVPQGAAATANGEASAVDGAPRPTARRKLDLEMLANQVGRIMSHLSYIAKDGAESDANFVSAEARAPLASSATKTAIADNAGGRDGGPRGRRVGKSADGSVEPANTAAPGGSAFGAAAAAGTGTSARDAPTPRADSRRQAIDRKHLELKQLHMDLVQRVAAIEAEPPSRPLPPPAGSGDGIYSAAADHNSAAADALAEVEARIRTKLVELAELTMRPASKRHGSKGSGSSGGRGSSPGTARKRALSSDLASGNNEGGGGGGAADPASAQRQRRAHEEAALHMEVLAVLGARKRQVRGAVLPKPRYAAASATAVGGEDDSEPRQSLSPRSGRGTDAHAEENRLGGAAAGCGGAVLADLQDGLRAELLAIDNKIKARVLGSGAAVSRRA
ncbi:hypothetical protein Vafri_13609 [Volvox africanus]|nr:hypothetical protein Vafri_13609 [Volvox africanus]